LTKKGELFVWGQASFGEFQEPKKLSNSILNENPFTEISIGFDFGTALDKNGFVWAWGSNTKGEMG
jgi:alpha-tubulin suppressor-like RCC1 family protein